MTAARIQIRRVSGWRKPEGAVYVTRGTKWGNPYRVGAEGVPDNAAAVALYRAYLAQHPELVEAARRELRGKVLCCYCALDAPCHADVLLESVFEAEIREAAAEVWASLSPEELAFWRGGRFLTRDELLDELSKALQ